MQGTESPRFRPTLWTYDERRLPPIAVWDDPYADERRLIGFDALPEDFVLQEVLEVTEESFDVFSARWGSFARADQGSRADGLAGLSMLQAMARHFLAFAEDDLAGMLAAWPVEPPITEARRAWSHWEALMNDALRSFTLYVRADADESPTGHRVIDIQRRSTYAVAALQLAQIATEDRPARRCASETCGRPFTVQRSTRRRYDGTAHAGGVKYCSRGCAKAQGERERRRRRRSGERGSE